MTTVTTQNPVRSDLASTEAGGADRTTTPSRLWAVAGIGAALAGVGTIVTSSAVDVVYRDEFSHGSIDRRRRRPVRQDRRAVRLPRDHRAGRRPDDRLRAPGCSAGSRDRVGDSLAPVVALVGLAGTAVVSILGSGLDTEFMMPRPRGDGDPSTTAPPRSTTTGSAPSRGCGRSPAWPAWPSSWPSRSRRRPALARPRRAGARRPHRACSASRRWSTCPASPACSGCWSPRSASPSATGPSADRPMSSTDSDDHGRPGPPRTRPAVARPAQCAGARALDRPTAGRRCVLPAGRRRPARASRSGSTLAAPTSGPGHRARAGLRLAVRRDRAGVRRVLRDRAAATTAHQAFGWALGWIGLFWGLDGLAQSYVRYGVRADDALAGVNARAVVPQPVRGVPADDRGRAAR